MRKPLFLFVVLTMVALSAVAQTSTWRYVREITFPDSDTTFVRPYLCTVTSDGRVYVLSTTLTDINAHNAVYYADTGATTMTKLVDFHAPGADTTLVRHLRGIGSVGTDVIVNGDRPSYIAAGGSGIMFYWTGGEPLSQETFGFNLNGAGHGTIAHGVTLSKDTIAFTGITFNTSIRLYNFSFARTSPSRGSWISLAAYPLEPGGPHTAGFDVIRDCAVLPGGDYADTNTVWYTSRNSSDIAANGGIATWRGGTSSDPGSYKGARIIDPIGLLSLGTAVSYGITVDKNGYLWVAGIDSTRRWVKAFDVTTGLFATEIAELPSQNSFTNPDPAGAPLVNPVDVALTADGKTAYVSDATKRAVYVFEEGTVGVDDETGIPASFELRQNYPNPFNPSTAIVFSVPTASQVALIVRNSLGQEVARLADGQVPAGTHTRIFDASGRPSGMYFYTLSTPLGAVTKRMVLVK